VLTAPAPRALTAHEFHKLAEMPPALAWFADIDNPQLRGAYQNEV
jgi:integrase/recombinase XerD